MTYSQYCTRRGYRPPFKGWPVIRRSLFESWAQPGFHRFWRVWNPPIGYPLFLLYRALGGNRKRVTATILVFVLSGALHDLVVLALIPKWGPVITFAYLGFAVTSLLNLRWTPLLKQETWPRFLHVLVNVGLVVGWLETSRRLFSVVFWGKS